VPAKAVHLISPAYRRWLTPDFAEIEFELEGFDPKGATPWQARLLVTDLDSNDEARSTTPLDGTPRTFALPRPKFHRRAEIVLLVEDRRTKEPVCEGRWNLTNVPKEDLPNLSYFDSRGVFFHEGQGRFPIVAWTHTEPKEWKAFADAGFTGLCTASDAIDDKAAALARSQKLLLFVDLEGKPGPAGLTTDAINALRRVRQYPAVAGYCAMVSADGPNALRQTDWSRPVIAKSPYPVVDGEDLHHRFREFEDVLVIHDLTLPNDGRIQARCARSGRAYFQFLSNPVRQRQSLETAVYLAVARGAAGVFVSMDAATRSETKERVAVPVPPSEHGAALKNLAPLMHAVVRGVPEKSDDSTKDRWFWRRRLGPHERAVIEVKRTDPPTATFSVFRDSP
jgi:hypothetical protein